MWLWLRPVGGVLLSLPVGLAVRLPLVLRALTAAVALALSATLPLALALLGVAALAALPSAEAVVAVTVPVGSLHGTTVIALPTALVARAGAL